MAGEAPEGRGDPELRVVVRAPLQALPLQALPLQALPLQALEDRAVVRVDSDLKARKPGSLDNPDRADSRDSAPNLLPKSANAS